ncbi:hypothetical protein T4B_15470 [Trichinella pseudospiralis]|uniref:Uncharacterized protein n=1 Tax=Trichinella pseudospiralis TaxID=6337 RepID=A0A0V1J906_TRIPS|nr:hypothetical protein T4B_15470 [Trichinella pseudospiralis]KRZ32264.1 hypothetical protein T4C_8839 [Trichinella pseudospiralis]KRZ32268.1 hypothetical protein T4C_1271 [Trichinella pseudospiralis]
MIVMTQESSRIDGTSTKTSPPLHDNKHCRNDCTSFLVDSSRFQEEFTFKNDTAWPVHSETAQYLCNKLPLNLAPCKSQYQGNLTHFSEYPEK